jgi:dTDP-4-dehydrorhamnose 3,5-epimerase
MDAFAHLDDLAAKRDDDRGWLQVLYESETMVLKRSFSRAGVFRGLHAQRGTSPQVKVIRVVSGRITDFVADLDDPERPLAHQVLGPEHGWVKIAAHFAHGFYAQEDTVFEYACDGGYDEMSESAYSIVAQLAALGINDPILSPKDRAAPPLKSADA